MMPPLPEPVAVGVGYWDEYVFGYTRGQMTEYAQACIAAERERILRIAYEQSTAYGKPGECMWVGIKSRVRNT